MNKNFKAHQAYIAAIGKDWDVWRKYYDDLTIEDLVWLNTAVSQHFGIQNHFNFGLINQIFDMIFTPHKAVLELGCYRGYLAERMLKTRNDILWWTGFDVNHYSIAETHVEDTRYMPFKMVDWLWNTQLPPINYHIFVASHTFEHMNAKQILSTISFLFMKSVRYLIIEMPLSNKAWKGYNGSHVYDGSKKDFLYMMELGGYVPFVEKPHNVIGFELKRG